jgi:hypothetical protein
MISIHRLVVDPKDLGSTSLEADIVPNLEIQTIARQLHCGLLVNFKWSVYRLLNF